MIFYEDERADLEQQAMEATGAVDLTIAFSPVIAFPLTIEGIGVERMLDPVPVTQTQGGLYLVQTPFQEAMLLGNPVDAQRLAPMRARFLVVKGWYDTYMDLLPEFERERAIAQFFDGFYLYLGPEIQYRKRGQVAPPDVVEAWRKEVEQRSRTRGTVPAQRVVRERAPRPTAAEMKDRVLVAGPEDLPPLMATGPAFVIVDVRPRYPDVRELSSTYGGRYFRQGSWWKPTKEGLASPEEGVRQVLPLLEAGKTVVLYCSCSTERDSGKRPCHRTLVRERILAALDRLVTEEESARHQAREAIKAGGGGTAGVTGTNPAELPASSPL
jgi:hypothetical protein